MNLLDLGQLYFGAYNAAAERRQRDEAMQAQADQTAWERGRAEKQDQLAADQLKAQADARRQLFDATKRLRNGDASALDEIAAINPELGAKYRSQFDEANNARRQKTATVMRQLSTMPEGPQRDMALDYVFRNSEGPDAMFARPDYHGSDVTPEGRAQFAAQADAVLGPEKAPERKVDNDMVIAASRLGYGGDVAAAEKDPRWGATLDKLTQSRGTTVNNNVGGPGGPAVGLTTAGQTSVQGEVMDADKSLAQLDRIDKAVADAGGAASLASLWERGKAAAGSVAANTPIGGMVDKEGLRKRRFAESAIATFRNAIFNKLSGAAVSDAEMDRLMQSVPDVGDSEADLTAKIAAWRSNLEFERKYGMDALLKGLASNRGPGAEPGPRPEALAGSPGASDIVNALRAP